MAAEPARYLIYGLRVSTDLPMPFSAEVGSPAEPSTGWHFARARVGQSPPALDRPPLGSVRCPHGETVIARHGGPGRGWLWYRSLATFRIEPRTRTVLAYPDAGADDRLLALVLAGQVSLFLLHGLGIPALHASAIETGRGIVAFLGPKGSGKSTMAASFLRRGATLVTDDALPLRLVDGEVVGVPGPPMMKVWRETVAHTLALTEELPSLAPPSEKKLFRLDGRYACARSAARVRAIYLLDRYDPGAVGRAAVEISTLSGPEGLVALLSQTACASLLQPDEMARLLQVYSRLLAQAPVRALHYPDGFGRQETVCRRVLADQERV